MTIKVKEILEPRYIDVEEVSIEEVELAQTDYSNYVYEEEEPVIEKDSAKVFFSDDDELDFSPTVSDAEFIERKEAVSTLLDECMKPLIDRIEAQQEMLCEKDLEIERIGMQLKLLPDLKNQVRVNDEALKTKHFENEALKKQIELTKEDRKTADEVSKLSNALIESIETKAGKYKNDLEKLKEENKLLKENNSRLVELNRPWWQKLFG